MRSMKLRFASGIACLASLVLASTAAAQGTPIGFEEEFALSSDRAETLEQLIPGTEQYYYYHCLHLQNEGLLDQVGPLMKLWIQRHGRDSQVEEIENRQALLRFQSDPAATYSFLRRRLGLRFDHQRQVSGEKPDLPTRLDPKLLSPATLTRRALARHPRTLDGFRESAFASLVGGPLDDNLLISLLKRLERPDLPNLPALVVRNLNHKQSRGFGSLPIHGHLLLEQLEECARLRPALLRRDAFIQAYLRRLRPNSDVDWRRNPDDREAYLSRLRQFTLRLAPAHNSLKAHVLYHRLVHDLGRGRPNKQRFLAYLRLPRQAGYVNPDFLKSRKRSDELVNFGQTFTSALGPIGSDEALVRAYLSHFFVSEDSYEPYADFVREDYLSRLFAETKILSGSDDMERWYSMLDDPVYYEQLKQRVEIEFPPDQRTEFGVDEPVSLEVVLKNVDTLLVKVFEINTLNYHSEQHREVDASINLDGLVANQESTYTYQEGPLRRARRRFEFEQIRGPGVYVVDFIGNGLSSRAVVRKGRLKYLERQGSAGHILAVLDGEGQHLKDASIRLVGHEYLADEQGQIRIPYSTKPGRRPIILRHGRFSTLEQFEHRAESYQLAAGIFLEGESLLPGQQAKLLLRPTLLLNGRAVSLELLEQVTLKIESRDWRGVASSVELRELELSGRGEFVHEIQVPEQLASLSVRLLGRVRNLSRAETIALDSGPRRFRVSAIEETPLTACPLLGRTDKGFVLDLLGKNGEPRPDQAVHLTLTHRDYTDSIQVTLKTDARGRITLGALDGIETVAASGMPNGFGSWSLRPADRTYPFRMQGRAGQALRVPYQGRATTLTREVASLLELRAGAFTHDRFDHLFLVNGELELRDLLPGDYSLLLKEAGHRMELKISSGSAHDGWALGRARLLELGGSAPLRMVEIRVEGDQLLVRLAHAGAAARVHLFATRYLPAFDVFSSLRIPSPPELLEQPATFAASSYHSGREIGDEYRYILERRYAKKFPGNMLRRPGLLLNPWALSETEAVLGSGRASKRALGVGGGAGGKFGGKKRASGGRAHGTAGTFPSLAFLATPSRMLVNLKPDSDGVVRVPLSELGDGQLVHAVALDGESTVYRSLALPEQPRRLADRRLRAALDPARHFAERKQIDFVEAGATAVIRDVATSQVESYDSLASVHQLFLTLSGNPDLARFEFLLRWPELDDDQKRKLYSEHACHELHFFLSQKDPAFFSAVIRPYLTNKTHKTFLDRWLLEQDLSRYLDPWNFSRLNVVEQILLSRRLESRQASVARHIRDRLELRPADPEDLNLLFETALKSGSLDRSEGIAASLESARKQVEHDYKGPSDSAAPGRRRSKPGPAMPSPRAPEEEQVLEDGPFERRDKDLDDALAREVDEEGKRAQDLRFRAAGRPLYRAPPRTRRFVEHNYWHRPIEEQDSRLIEVNSFWRDYADARGNEPFFSTHFPEAAGSFAEMMLALAVLDLPYQSAEHALETEGSALSIQAASPLLLVRKELRESTSGTESTQLQIHQNFFRLDDRERHEGSVRYDKFVSEEFLTGVAYGCQVVLTNPGSAALKLELLCQVPKGALPVERGFLTRGVPLRIDAYGTAKFEYAFYFPEAGHFPHYPVHASRGQELLAFADPLTLKVVDRPSQVDTDSWEHISQSGTPEQVIEYLEAANLLRPDLTRIAWRMREQGFFDAVVGLLRRRHVYDHTLWSYGLLHQQAPVSREYLRHHDGFLRRCGRYLDTPLVSIDPIERRAYQHVEYAPLFNGRAHRFGRRREILNRDLARQYLALLRILAYRPRLDDSDWMSVSYYLLLQDRVEEAIESFARVDATGLNMVLQHDYMRAYIDFFSADRAQAREIAENYRNHPVERWRSMFQDVLNQLDEAAGIRPAAVDPEDRTQRQTELAAGEPSLELKVEAQDVSLRYLNLERCEISYFVMDIEFLFSTSAFVAQGSGSFSFIQPNRSDSLELSPAERELRFDLPAEFQNKNVLVEVRGGGLARRQAYYANSLSVQLIENYGQLKVTHRATNQPLSRVYVKVYARRGDGSVRFHKDGYTDPRGRFDYASLSGRGAADAERYAILILSEDDGAVIREVSPPVE